MMLLHILITELFTENCKICTLYDVEFGYQTGFWSKSGFRWFQGPAFDRQYVWWAKFLLPLRTRCTHSHNFPSWRLNWCNLIRLFKYWLKVTYKYWSKAKTKIEYCHNLKQEVAWDRKKRDLFVICHTAG